MNKDYRIDAAHAEYGKAMADMTAIEEKIKEVENYISTMNPPSAGTIVINLKNMRREMGNMKAAIAKDYIEELETLQKM